ncbi:hypothetical protein CAC42_7815 [Sphaceloma murrayae]|uniref:F-box domain-containing protein n=1 Tax=Sphaceloma murrayae TaxID=2082308 RepID=A0A2K1QXR8_9PEZI|nr:hypothetical protein CAC42_7815 [Sphaceloma murrayae]
MGTSLPAEIELLVFEYLDPFAFHSISRVSRSWHYGSRDVLVLRQRLAKLPLLVPAWPTLTNAALLRSYWLQGVESLMLNASLQTSSCSRASVPSDREGKLAYSSDLRRLVSLNARTLKLFAEPPVPESSQSDREVLSQVILNDVRSKSRQGPILRNAPSCVFEIALASKSSLVAVALDRIVQVYDMSAPNEPPAAAFLSAAAGHFVTGVSFEADDSLLRISLSNKGVVLYLGSPQAGGVATESSLDYWRSDRGLKHVLLNSTLLTYRASPTDRLACLQLLRRYDTGFLASAQRHRGSTALGYTLVFVPIQALGTSATTSAITSVVDLAASHGQADSSSIFWSATPLVKEQARPRYCVSPDDKLLAIVEEGSSHYTPARTENRIFVWRLPDRLLDSGKQFSLSGLEIGTPIDMFARLPLYLAEVAGTVLSLRFDRWQSSSYNIVLETSVTKMTFALEGII